MQWTDWLIVFVVVAVFAVLVDGLRRRLSERRTRVVMKLEKNIPQDVDPEELPNSELPNGGARAVPREGQPMPSLRTLQARRKLAFRQARSAEDSGARAVPVLLDTVDVEEERIEHTNVFGDPRAVPPQADDFAADVSLGPVREVVRGAAPQAEAITDDLNEEYEEDAMLAEPEVARREPGYMETRYQGRRDEDDEDEFEDDDEEFEDEDEEEDEDDEDFDEFEDSPDEFEDDDEEDEDEDEEEDDEEDEDEDDFDDEDDDYDDEEEDDEDDDYDDEDEEEEDDEEDDEDLDELEGLPEDDWGNEEEQDVLVDDYENEPMPLQGAFDKAASQLDRVATQAATQLDKVASQAATQLDKVASQAATQLDKVASHAASQFDRAASQAASRFKRAPEEEQRRIEPGFGADGPDAESLDDFAEDFSGAWNDTADALEGLEEIEPRPAAPQAAAARREQGELFGAPEKAAARDDRKAGRDESRLLAALQKAVPRAAPAPAPVAAAPTPQEVIIINVMARAGHVLHGGDLLSVLQEQGLRLGDMSIFHRHANSDGSGPVMFSMANMVKPGTFELATMDEFTTPGVSFFLQMPNRLGNMACFDRMLAAASAVRDAFDAELKDEHRSVFTRQTVEHCRQRVRDFELKLLSRK